MKMRSRKKTAISRYATRTARLNRSTQENTAEVVPPRALVPVDLKPALAAALERIATSNAFSDMEIVLLHVVAPIFSLRDFGYGPVTRQQVDALRLKRAEARLRAAAQRHLAGRRRWQIEVRTGRVAEQIVRAAWELDIESIVMLGSLLAGDDDSGPGDVHREVFQTAPCSVILLKAAKVERERDTLIQRRNSLCQPSRGASRACVKNARKSGALRRGRVGTLSAN